jgi:hypothetical protein
MEALGRLFDIVPAFTDGAVDLQSAQTGIRVNMEGVQGVTIVIVKGIGTAGDDPTYTLQEHTAYTGGTSANLVEIDHWYIKSDTTAFDGAETWTKTTQTAAATATDATWAETDTLIVIEVAASALSDGYTHLSVNVGDVGSNAQLGAILYILHGLNAQRAPANLPQRLT